MTDFPLLNQEELDFSKEIDSHPDVDAQTPVVLHADFAREQLPWWLTYETDNGPASPTFNGLASGDTTDCVLETGTTNNNDVTVLSGPTINWDNWSAVRFYAYRSQTIDEGKSVGYVMLADNRANDELSNGFWLQWHSSGASRAEARVYNSGSHNHFSERSGIDVDSRNHYGFRVYQHTSEGHTFTPVVHSMAQDNIGESQSNYPPASNLTFYVGIRTIDTAATRKMNIDGVYLELVP